MFVSVYKELGKTNKYHGYVLILCLVTTPSIEQL